MVTRIVSRYTRSGRMPQFPRPEVLVERELPRRGAGDLICPIGGKNVLVLEFVGTQDDESTYNVKADTCIWILLTDCNGNIQAATQYTCITGNTLIVDGCHAFNCDCSQPVPKG